MSASAESIRVKIGGNEYSIKTDVDIETTKRIAEYVDHKMSELKKITAIHDNLKLAIIAALNIAEELHDYQEKYKIVQMKFGDFEKRAISISDKIDMSIRNFDR